MPSRSIIRTGVGPHREPGNRFPAMAAAINLLAARAARVQSRRNLSRSLSPKLDHSHSITRFDRSRTGPKSYRGSGSASYHPAVLLGVVVYGYATGVFSSRKLERATYDSVAVRVLTANQHPDHDTLATFRRRFLAQIEGL